MMNLAVEMFVLCRIMLPGVCVPHMIQQDLLTWVYEEEIVRSRAVRHRHFRPFRETFHGGVHETVQF